LIAIQRLSEAYFKAKDEGQGTKEKG